MRDHGPSADERVRPDADAAKDDRARAKGRAVFDDRAFQRPVSLGLEGAVTHCCAWTPIVDEHDAVPDEDAVSDLDSGADKGVTLNFAVSADDSAALDLHERPYAGVVTDAATVEVGESAHESAFAELDVVN
jgi:hypothetical protein